MDEVISVASATPTYGMGRQTTVVLVFEERRDFASIAIPTCNNDAGNVRKSGVERVDDGVHLTLECFAVE